MPESEVLCFHCAQPIGDPPRLNELGEGEVCPVCRDRLLEELPPIVHSPVRTNGTAWGRETAEEPDLTEESTGPRLLSDESPEDPRESRDAADSERGSSE